MSTLKSILSKRLFLPIADKYFKTEVAIAYKEIKKQYRFSKNDISSWQNEKLRHLIFHAFNHCKYYKNKFEELNISVDDITSVNDLYKLPILTKENIRWNFDAILPDNVNLYPYKKSATGGSTGDPLIYFLDNKSWSRTNANYLFNWEKAGYSFGDPYLALGSSSLFVNKTPSLKHKLYYSLKGKIGLNGINMSSENCRDYLALIKHKNIKFIYGYASSIYLLAKFALEHKISIKLNACFPTSEMLTDLYRSTIIKAFDCSIVNCYGANDGGVTAFSHNKNFFEVGYNSIIRIEKNNQSQRIGSVLLTDLFNYSMPLINYKLGDEVLIDDELNKDYYYNGQIVNDILGRSSDIIMLENGNTITGPGFTVLFKDLPVEAYCIKKTDFNKIECDIIKLDNYTTYHEDIIKSSFKNQMGVDAIFSINYVSEIPLSSNGKRKYFQD